MVSHELEAKLCYRECSLAPAPAADIAYRLALICAAEGGDLAARMTTCELNRLAVACDGDMRVALNTLMLWAADGPSDGPSNGSSNGSFNGSVNGSVNGPAVASGGGLAAEVRRCTIESAKALESVDLANDGPVESAGSAGSVTAGGDRNTAASAAAATATAAAAVYEKGDIVEVAKRTMPGINKLGGTARITKVTERTFTSQMHCSTFAIFLVGAASLIIFLFK